MNRVSPYYAVSLLLSLALLLVAPAFATAWEWRAPSGHVKYQYQGTRYSDNSLYRSLVGTTSSDHLLDNRWKFSGGDGRWSINADYQLQAVHGDRQQLSGAGFVNSGNSLPSDAARLWDLTKTVSDDEDIAILHRLDRFNIGYTTDNTVIRAGRQVLSWGNGLMFNPMDFFNPFDPVALDKEYKTGDDMLYAQRLFDSGADLQGVWVVRRDPADSDIDRDQNSVAAKYHTWLGDDSGVLQNAELDLLAASHYDDDIIGAGLIKSLGGAVWRTDLLWTHTDRDDYASFVTNLSYSWVWNDTNWSGVIEYFYNGLGLSGDDYTLADIRNHPDLLKRLQRGELYSIGRHYLAASATIELTPLWLATPALFTNLNDQSALLQLGSQYSLAQNWQLTAALNIPLGSKNTEYGGLKISAGGPTIATDGGVFIQLAFYY